jgi:hypothetical protein
MLTWNSLHPKYKCKSIAPHVELGDGLHNMCIANLNGFDMDLALEAKKET